MKRIIVCCLVLLCAAPVIASTICAEDDVITIVLDPAIGSTGIYNNADLMEWGVAFPYGSVWGAAACVDVAGSGQGQIGPEDFTDSNGAPVVGGERTGKYCWLQMRHPARSRWVYYGNIGSVDSCLKNCAYYGSNSIRVDVAMRPGMFGSVGN